MTNWPNDWPNGRCTLCNEIIEHKSFIGGRYSVLSETGMFPAALMGLNLIKFRLYMLKLKVKKILSILGFKIN